MDRTILHVDCNKFFASVECLHHPEIRSFPVVVGGREEARHGIVLTKNEIASKYGIETAEPLWKARQKCSNLIVVPPNYPLYVRFSKLVREILKDYSNNIEPFGLDEAWVDVSESAAIFGNGEKIAEEIRQRIKFELGITVSIGVSYNKIFAKLGSDYKKPDAITIISKDNFKKIVWPLPAYDLLWIGKATYKKLCSHYRYTIGDVANTDPELLHRWFGKNGYMLHSFANGYNKDPVMKTGYKSDVKSISNSVTSPRDLVSDEDVKSVFLVLSESVARRLREQGLYTQNICISLRNNMLNTVTCQRELDCATNITAEICETAYNIYKTSYQKTVPLRSVGICAKALIPATTPIQLDIFKDQKNREKKEKIDQAVDILKHRYGNECITLARIMKNNDITCFDPYSEHTVHPIGYFNTARK